MNNLSNSQILSMVAAALLIIGSLAGALFSFESWTQALPGVLAGLGVLGIHPNLP
jgi:hypothetical protein